MRWWLILLFCAVGRCENILDAISGNPDLSKFAELVQNDDVVPEHLKTRTATLFAPTNEAVERGSKWLEKEGSKVATYHLLNSLAPKSVFNTSSRTAPDMSGAPSLNLAKKMTKDGQMEYYVNNAKIIDEQEYTTSSGQKQLLYIIDEMLEPYVAIHTSTAPTAIQLMEQPSTYNIPESLSRFLSRVKTHGLYSRFSNGRATYFLPVDPTDSQSKDWSKEMDSQVVRGHFIPNKVLFTRVAGGEIYRSDLYSSSIKVELSIINETGPNAGEYVMYAKSNVLESHHAYRKGLVLSKILIPNIPVANGVVHLIETPLMIIDHTIWGFIAKERDGRLREFYNLAINSSEFRALVENSQVKTLFAPSNEAIEHLSKEKLDKIRHNQTLLSNLLKLHLVMRSISSDEVSSGQAPREKLSADNHRNLYFRVVGEDKNRILTVEGGGVNATAVLANIGATDGLIHIVDRVLGMPYQTVYEKLKNDPTLRTTFELSEQQNWNIRLHDNEANYTFFAPSEQAWIELKSKMPSAFKQIHMGILPQHVNHILDRHLVIGEELTIQDLEKRGQIQMEEGIFKISSGYQYGTLIVKWEGEEATIVRPGVQATNGVIHVIDRVMMKPRDLSTTSADNGLRYSLLTVTAFSTLLLVF